ncbi:MAG: CPBP family intramembrane metalloprotease, partial [Candidatus Saccharicenans sp.]|nr:CPBP family intramembrane metalloprotease [Candidatus Saccharicenans sp.]
FTIYFFLLLFTLLPFLKYNFAINPALYWFITGYFLFIPLFLFAILMARKEGNNSFSQILQALSIKPFTKKDWQYSIIGLLLVFVLSGLIFAGSFLLNRYYGTSPLTPTPWFMEIHPFRGQDKLLLLVWLPMFFFNIVGEEMLWRGYIQARLQTKYAWFLCSILWMMFHLPFGFDLLIMLIPILIIIPYVFDKTKNSLKGIFIHGLYNGPVFVLVALGLIK